MVNDFWPFVIIIFKQSSSPSLYTKNSKTSNDGVAVKVFVPRTNVVKVQIPYSAQHVGWVSCSGSHPCSKGFLSGFTGFPPSTKTNISKFQFDLGSI